MRVEASFDKACSTYNLVIVSLLIKTLRFVIKHNGSITDKQVVDLNTAYIARLDKLLSGSKNFTPEVQVFLKDVTKTCIVLQSHTAIGNMT